MNEFKKIKILPAKVSKIVNSTLYLDVKNTTYQR